MSPTLVVLATVGANHRRARRAITQVLTTATRPVEMLLVLDEPQQAPDLVAFAHDRSIPVATHAGRVGLVAAYNVGFRRFLDGDAASLMLLEDNVVVTPGWDQALHQVLDAHPQFGWVACGQIENPLAPFTALCSLMSRACAEVVRGLDVAFAPCQFDDGDLFMRCQQAGFRPHGVPHLVSHPESRTSRTWTPAEDVDLMLAHRELFRARWGLPDMPWASVPVHHPCPTCAGDHTIPPMSRLPPDRESNRP